MFVVKACYRSETRRFTLSQTHFPSFDQIYNQINRVFPADRLYYLSKFTLTPLHGGPVLVASEIHSEEDYRTHVAAFVDRSWNYAKLRFDVLDEPVEKTLNDAFPFTLAVSAVSSDIERGPIQTPKQPPKPGSTRNGKAEMRGLLSKFVSDFNSIIDSSFGDEDVCANSLSVQMLTKNENPPSALTYTLSEVGLEGIHPGVWCDYCGRQVRGIRHKCNQCSEYDLCTDCVVKQCAKEVHISNCEQQHTFRTVEPPNPSGTANSEASSVPGLIRPVHIGVICDACEGQIAGNRHKCLDCPNYDLCESCIQRAPTMHPLHEFLKIGEPGRIVVHTVGAPSSNSLVHAANCDLCDSRIHGDRFKCMNCPDYDVCHRCITITPEQHPHHKFVKIREPNDIMGGKNPQEQVAHSASCNSCAKMIYGYRYKCMHPSCPDYDLCMNCEALPIAVHPITHPLWKLKVNTITSTLPALAVRQEYFKNDMQSQNHQQECNRVYSYLTGENAGSHSVVQSRVSLSSDLMLESRHCIDEESDPTPPTIPELKASFVSDNNMEDGVNIAPGAEFVKSWKLKNSGDIAWPEGTCLSFVGGERLAAFEGAPIAYMVGAVETGTVVDVWAADMKAPDEAGIYISYWSLTDAYGKVFGDRLWCHIVVPEIESGLTDHSGSVVLPTPLRSKSGEEVTGVASKAFSPSILTETATSSVHSGSRNEANEIDLTDGDSDDSEEWEDTPGVDAAPRAMRVPGELAQSPDLEYVVLYESDEEGA